MATTMALLLLLLTGVAAAADPTTMTLRVVPDSIASPLGARCLDGAPSAALGWGLRTPRQNRRLMSDDFGRFEKCSKACSWLPQSPARRLNYGAQERGSCDAHAPADERIVFT